MFCREVHTFVKSSLENMCKEYLWMKSVTYNICVQCPVCSKGGVTASECDVHRVSECKRDQCLHYVTEDELVQNKNTLRCAKSRDPTNTVISREKFTPWFKALESKVCAAESHLHPLSRASGPLISPSQLRAM